VEARPREVALFWWQRSFSANIAVRRAQLQTLLFGNPSHNLHWSGWAARRALLSRIGCATILRSVSFHQTKFVFRTFQNNNRRSRQAA